MKKIFVIPLLVILFCSPSFAQLPFGPRLQAGDLKVVQLEMSPDPVREGQQVSFEAIVSNLSRHPGKVSLFIKDKDEVVAAVYDIRIKPGDNRIDFPQSNYRFSRNEYCFTVEVDIERTKGRWMWPRNFAFEKHNGDGPWHPFASVHCLLKISI
jgi:hypothetical protein